MQPGIHHRSLRETVRKLKMSSNVQPTAGTNHRKSAIASLIVMLVSVMSVFAASSVLADTPATITPRAAITVETESAFGLPPAIDANVNPLPIGVGPFDLEMQEAKDLFGTVISVTVLPDGFGVLVINTRYGIVYVLTDEETQIKLPRNRDAEIVALVAGDLVAVSLEEEDGVLVADKVFLVPGKTQYRHVPGEIVSLIYGDQITIQPPGSVAEQLTFSVTGETKTNLMGRAEELSEGLFVVVSAVRDPLTGGISGNALEINVTRGGSPTSGAKSLTGPSLKSENTAEIRGVLALDDLGSWTINGIAVAIDPDTQIEGGLVLGRTVRVEGVLQEDGTILGLEIETEGEEDFVSDKTELEGVFHGIASSTGKWIISGNLVDVGPGTDTDGLPLVGQRVKVEAIRQDDGSLLAREVENKGGSADGEENSKEVKLEGTFLGIDPDGKWIVNGALVLIDPQTRLKGEPTVGERIRVNALFQPGGSLLAVKIDGKSRGNSNSENKAELRGTIDDILEDGTLVVGGLQVSLSPLTDLDFDPEIGESVKVEASLQPDGSLIAKEVEEEKVPETKELSEPIKSEIEGTIETVNPDGSLVVNGITVIIDVDAEIKGNLVNGSEVKLAGILQENGTLLAQKLKSRGRQAAARGSDREIDGLLEDILRTPDGNIIGVVVDELIISTESLTRFEGLLEVGAAVEVKGLEVNGQFIATKVEGEDSGLSRAEEARETGRAKAEERAERKREKEERKAAMEENRSGRGWAGPGQR